MLRKKTAELRPSRKGKKLNLLNVLKFLLGFVKLLTLLFKAIDKFWDVLRGIFDSIP